jgi:hypothetical protein
VSPTDSLKSDIAYMRDMADRGRASGPILGGAFLAAAGVIYGLAAFAQWGIDTGSVHLPLSTRSLWVAASILFAAVWLLLYFRLRRQAGPQTGSASQYAFGMAWAACGLGIMVLIGAIAIASSRLHNYGMEEASAFVAFAFYGTAWLINAVLARRKWMFVVAAAAFAITLLMACLSGTEAQLLVFGTGLIATLTLPGVRLMTSREG